MYAVMHQERKLHVHVASKTMCVHVQKQYNVKGVSPNLSVRSNIQCPCTCSYTWLYCPTWCRTWTMFSWGGWSSIDADAHATWQISNKTAALRLTIGGIFPAEKKQRNGTESDLLQRVERGVQVDGQKSDCLFYCTECRHKVNDIMRQWRHVNSAIMT